MAKKRELEEKIEKLKSKVKDLRSQLGEITEDAVAMLRDEVTEVASALREGVAEAAAAAAAAASETAAPAKAKNPVSPLAPAAFPALPLIEGVSFAAAAAGVRYAGRTDVMLAQIAPGSTIAGVFTTSTTRAACVLDCQAKLAGMADESTGAAIVVNSGNANAFTGAAGQASVDAVTGAVAEALDLPINRVFSSSTGVIGEPLPHERIVAAVPGLVAALDPAGMDGRRPGDHDHRHLSQGRHRPGQARQGQGHHQRHRQGRRHDRAGHGDHAGLRVHRCADLAGGAAGAAESRRRGQF